MLSYVHGNVSTRYRDYIADDPHYRYGAEAACLPVPAGQGHAATLTTRRKHPTLLLTRAWTSSQALVRLSFHP